MKYGQFASVTSPNADLSANKNIRNIGYYNGKIYWGYYNGVDTHLTYSTTSITGSTTTEESDAHVSGVNDNVVLRAFGDNIYSCSAGLVGVSLLGAVQKSTDGGSNWSIVGFGKTLAHDVVDTRMIDVFEIGTDYYTVYSWEYDQVPLECGVLICKNVTDTLTYNYTAKLLKNIDSVYAGKVNSDGDYEFYIHDEDDDYYKVTFDVSAGTYSEEAITGLTPPASFSTNTQQYWVQKKQEFLIDQDHFYYRTVGDTTWSNVSDTGSTTNGIIWGYDINGDYHLKFIIWKDSIYKIFVGGGIAKIQTYTGNAYVGYDDWFSEGTDEIHQLDP